MPTATREASNLEPPACIHPGLRGPPKTLVSGLHRVIKHLGITYRLGLIQARAAHDDVRSTEKVRIHDAIDISPPHEQAGQRRCEPCHKH